MQFKTFQATRAAVLRGDATMAEVVDVFLARIAEANPTINALLWVDEATARVRARELDALHAEGRDLPLLGMVMAIKDVLCIRDQPVTCASHILEGFTSLYDATAVVRLREAGAIFIGKANCDEFAMGSSNENSYFGPVRNPVDTTRVPGGSSGGSAAAVAAGFCHTALGTDTGGSIRQPAAFCGVVGLKPTYGRVSRYGLVAFASSFDTIGPFARTPEDAAAVLHVMAGLDPADATSAPVPVPDYTAEQTRGVAGLRIGLPREYYGDGLDPEIRAALDAARGHLEAAGATFTEVDLPTTEHGIATYYVLTTAEASSNLARYDGVRYGYRADLQAVQQDLATEREALAVALTEAEAAGDAEAIASVQAEQRKQDSALMRLYTTTRSEGFGEEVQRRIMLGTYVLSSGYYDAYYGKAQRVRTLIRRDFDRVFADVDVLLTPATPTSAFPLGSKTDDPLEMYLSDIYTVTANLAGIPGLVVPVGSHANGLPIGAQLLGPHFAEAQLFRVGQAVMATTD